MFLNIVINPFPWVQLYLTDSWAVTSPIFPVLCSAMNCSQFTTLCISHSWSQLGWLVYTKCSLLPSSSKVCQSNNMIKLQEKSSPSLQGKYLSLLLSKDLQWGPIVRKSLPQASQPFWLWYKKHALLIEKKTPLHFSTTRNLISSLPLWGTQNKTRNYIAQQR